MLQSVDSLLIGELKQLFAKVEHNLRRHLIIYKEISNPDAVAYEFEARVCHK